MLPSLCMCFFLFHVMLGGALGESVGEERRVAAMEEFMEEIRRAMSGQWEILQNIRFHTLMTKVRVTQLEAQVKKLTSQVGDKDSQLPHTGSEGPSCPGEADGGVTLLVEAMKDLTSTYNRLLNSTWGEVGQVPSVAQDLGVLTNVVREMNNMSETPADELTPTTTMRTTTDLDLVPVQEQDGQDSSGPRILVKYSPNVTVEAGGNATLSCRFSNLTSNNEVWIRNKDVSILAIGLFSYTDDDRFRSYLDTECHDYRLHIQSVRKWDEGAYSCSTGNASHQIWLTVEDVQKPSILANYSTNVTVEEGSTAILNCRVSNLGNASVFWFRDQYQKIVAADTITYISDPRVQAANVDESGDWQLKISAVQPSDEGWYKCVLLSQTQMSHRIWLSVVVTATPSPETDLGVESAGNVSTVRVGDRATLVCRVTNLGDGAVSWARVGGQVLTVGKYTLTYDSRFSATQREEDWLLQIDSVQKKDAGSYECHVSTLPPTSQTFWLQVEESESPQPEMVLGDVRTVQGKDVNLTCLVTGHPRSTIAWTKDGMSLISNRHQVTQDGDLVIRAVTLSDAGRYVCVASSPEGRAEDSVLLTLEEATTIVRPPRDRIRNRGETVVFRCKAQADSDLQLKLDWLVNGELVNIENELRLERRANNALVVKWLVEGDSGLYTCRASTQLDSVTASATLTVRGKGSKPSPADKPVALTTSATAIADDLCYPPFQAVGSGLCVLQVTDLRYTWLNALEYCRAVGAELASEPGIAALKVFLKERYSPGGDSWLQWPFWVGGREEAGGVGRWRWAADGTLVDPGVWAVGQPRPYGPTKAPEGSCMTLDGYHGYDALALPCHLRRRFLCRLQ